MSATSSETPCSAQEDRSEAMATSKRRPASAMGTSCRRRSSERDTSTGSSSEEGCPLPDVQDGADCLGAYPGDQHQRGGLVPEGGAGEIVRRGVSAHR